MNQDVSETCIRPINAQRLVVEKFFCSWVNGQKTEVLENFLELLVVWVVFIVKFKIMCVENKFSQSNERVW